MVFSKESGTVMIKTTHNNMKEIQKYINKINNIYSKQVEVKVTIYEFVLNRNYNFGTDISGKLPGINFATNNLVSSVLNLSHTTSKRTLKMNVNSDNQFMRYAKSYSYTQTFMNNITKNLVIQNSKDYIKSNSSTTTTNTATTTTSNTQIGTVNGGVDISITPRIIGNQVSLNVHLKINSINQLKEVVTPNGGSIFLPDQDEKDISSQLIMTSGERRLIGSYQNYQDEKTYNGVAPIEDFIIAGKSGKKFIKQEIFIVMGAKILK